MYQEQAGLGQLPSAFIRSPILFLIVLFRKNLKGLWEELKSIHSLGSDGVPLQVLVSILY